MIVLPGGGSVRIRSADNPDGLRGEGLDLAVLDECAFIDGDAWREAVRPALSDRQGRALFISTPKGRNWFWDLYQRGVSGEEGWSSHQFPTSTNPYILPEEIEAAKRDLADLVFRQEFLAEFVDFEGTVFRRIQEAATSQQLDGPEHGRQYAAGVDLASSVDYTVCTVLDIQARRMVYMDRFNRVDYNVLEDRLAALHDRWHLSSMTVETNGIGQPVLDALYARGLPLVPFTTTSATKQAIITGLQSAFEHGAISIIPDQVLIGELLSFEGRRSPSGAYTYSAPPGQHDDCVMSLAIAWHSISPDTWVSVGGYR
jgi:phage FluMu gp28-like protein